jgi:hypothetical protein
MSSGSYFPPPVRAVPIPKKNGGQRLLGVPTVTDRVAQMVVKKIVEREVEPIFLPDSYGYRPNKSAIDAIGERPLEARWNLGSSKSGQIRSDQAKLLPHPRHPSEPYDTRFVVAVDEHGSLGLAPRCTKPVVSVKQLFPGNIARRPLRSSAPRHKFASQGWNT